MELVVTDLAASRHFYVDVLGLVVTEEDETEIYLRSFEEFIHHNLVLKQGPVAAVSAFSDELAKRYDKKFESGAPAVAAKPAPAKPAAKPAPKKK